MVDSGGALTGFREIGNDITAPRAAAGALAQARVELSSDWCWQSDAQHRFLEFWLGVEDADDWHIKRAQGCHLAQGYFIGRPRRSPAGLKPGAAPFSPAAARPRPA